MMDTTQSVESELILSGSTRGFLRLQAAYFLPPRSLNLVGVTSEVLLKYYVISFLPVTATYLALYPNNPAAYIYIPKFVHALSPLLSISTIPIAALLQLIILVVGLSPILVLTQLRLDQVAHDPRLDHWPMGNNTTFDCI